MLVWIAWYGVVFVGGCFVLEVKQPLGDAAVGSLVTSSSGVTADAEPHLLICLDGAGRSATSSNHRLAQSGNHQSAKINEHTIRYA